MKKIIAYGFIKKNQKRGNNMIYRDDVEEYLERYPDVAKSIIVNYLKRDKNNVKYDILEGLQVAHSTRIVACAKCGNPMIHTYWVYNYPLCKECLNPKTMMEWDQLVFDNTAGDPVEEVILRKK